MSKLSVVGTDEQGDMKENTNVVHLFDAVYFQQLFFRLLSNCPLNEQNRPIWGNLPNFSLPDESLDDLTDLTGQAGFRWLTPERIELSRRLSLFEAFQRRFGSAPRDCFSSLGERPAPMGDSAYNFPAFLLDFGTDDSIGVQTGFLKPGGDYLTRPCLPTSREPDVRLKGHPFVFFRENSSYPFL
ncbi:hypothetical protein IPG41_03570 [Candidatus Peregrinibacteria bacterium]|nr:MAG: hypothetical protein IPG41_03570 [Candidatus Peregrinibacteria bacterium]